MDASIPTSVATLKKRAASFRAIVDDKTHRKVSVAVQSTWASLVVAAELMEKLPDAAMKTVDEKEQARKTRPGFLSDADLVVTALNMSRDFPQILEAGALLARGKDVAVLKQLGKQTFGLVAKIAAKLSGYELVKDAADVASAVKDAVKTGQLLKMRTKQASTATDLLGWLDGVMLASLAWSYRTQVFLNDPSGRKKIVEDDILEKVLKTVVEASQSWDNAKR